MSKLIATKLTRLPAKGQPGDVYFTTDTKEYLIAIGDGTLIPTYALFHPHSAAQWIGPRGPQGETGATGAASTIPGPQGPQGANGDKGDRGDVLYVGPAEIEAAAKALRAQRAQMFATLQQGIKDAQHLAPGMKKTLVNHYQKIINDLQ